MRSLEFSQRSDKTVSVEKFAILSSPSYSLIFLSNLLYEEQAKEHNYTYIESLHQNSRKTMTQFYNEYSKVLVSVDCIIFGFDGSNLQVLIGKRKMDPGRGEWSLYGGFVGATENLEDAANRVILELTGMKNLYIRQVGAFGRIDRDPGERVISIAYCTLINVKDYDDSLRVEHGLEWVSLNELPELYSDHKLMIRNAIAQIRRRINHEPLSFKLLPDLFTLTQLQHVFEAVIGEEIDKRNFRKRVKDIDFIEKTELIDKVNSKRGAALYRFNKKAYEEDPSFNLK